MIAFREAVSAESSYSTQAQSPTTQWTVNPRMLSASGK